MTGFYERREPIYAFIDEYGNVSLSTEKAGTSNFFICVAVLINESDIERAKEGVQAIQDEFFSGSQIKSSNVGSKDERRLPILDAITKLPFSYVAVIVDKNRVYKDSGLRYKGSFYKYMSRQLHNLITRSSRLLRIHGDQFGTNDFMQSFKAYMQKKVELSSLWRDYEFCFVKSKDEFFIQIADFVAGTLARIHDDTLASQRSREFRSLLLPKQISIILWPLRNAADYHGTEDESEHDFQLAKAVIACSMKVLRQIEGEDELNLQRQEAVLRHLLYKRLLDREEPWVYSSELHKHLEKSGFPRLSDVQLTTDIIGGLRDKGIIIAGSTRGYRLALSSEDVQQYLKHDSSIIEPMLNRLRRARETVWLDTNKQLDILDYLPNTALKSLVEVFTSERDNAACIQDS